MLKIINASIAAIVILGCTSVNAQASPDANEKSLGIAAQKIVDQAVALRKAFDANKINIQTDQYTTLHKEAFSVSDQVEMYLHAKNIYKELDTSKAEAMSYYIARIKNIAALHCEISQIDFNSARDSKRLPQGVLTAVNIQSKNIERVCELLDGK